MKSTKSLVAGAIGALALVGVWAGMENVAAAGERPIEGVVPGSEFIPTCEAGQQQAGKRFCISKEKQKKQNHRKAVSSCESQGARVCTSEDLLELHAETDLGDQYDPNGAWLGDLRVDGGASCGVDSIVDGDRDADFVGTCDEDESRSFWCCSDM